MKINKITGYAWPIVISCNKCGVTTFEVNMPSDMRRHVEHGYKLTDGEVFPYVKRKFVTATCPCCGAQHEVSMEELPDIIINKIPLDHGAVPFCG